MADFQIGNNLYADGTGKWFNVQTGNYKDANGNTQYGQYRNYIQSPFDSSQDKINQLYDAQRKSQLDALKSQRDKAISGFNQQKKDLAPQYQAQRNQADVVNAQNVTRLRELMAANGINASGESLTTQANLASARQNSLNDINNNENQAMGAIDRQIANVNDPSQEQAINNSVETDRSKAMLDAYNQAMQEIYQREQQWKDYVAQQEQIAAQKAAAEAAAAARAKASSSSSSAQSTAPSQQDTLAQAYQQYKTEQSQPTVVDQYYNAIDQTLNKGRSVIQKPVTVQDLYSKYGIAPQPIATNPNLSDWQRMKLLGL